MEIAPFRIRKRTLSAGELQVKEVPINNSASHTSPNVNVAYYAVESTAPHNIDQRPPSSDHQRWDSSWEQAHRGIAAIAQDLHRIKTDPTIAEDPELVIAVHGYNTSVKGVKAWYNDIFMHVAKDDAQMKLRRNHVFIGYRWPSENILYKRSELLSNLKALPNVPQTLFVVGAVLLMLYVGEFVADVLRSLEIVPASTLTRTLIAFLFGGSNSVNVWLEVFILLLVKVITGFVILAGIAVLTLWALRISVYFRDVYRAINFAVPDLTDLIRRLDRALVELEESQTHLEYAVPIDANREADDRSQIAAGRVHLSFVAHSMGALVVTNTVKVISDVFDPCSIEQKPTANIGRMLRLSHLVLASPDIPVLSVVSSRANGLASSLRRFDEAYLFSNEGDLALRLASTTANYISFPSTDQHHGHRLGSIAIRNYPYEKGIINLKALEKNYSFDKPLNKAIRDDGLDILQCLYITHQSGDEGDGYQSLDKLYADEHEGRNHATVSDMFTFFDCTDYQDYRIKLTPGGMNRRDPEYPVGLLTRPSRNKRKFLKLRDYINIVIDSRKGLNCHGGYFQGEFTRKLMYRLAFMGFEETLNAIARESSTAANVDAHDALKALHQTCMNKGIQAYLSPLRYRVDVQKANVRDAKSEMLEVVQDAGAEVDIDDVLPQEKEPVKMSH